MLKKVFSAITILVLLFNLTIFGVSAEQQTITYDEISTLVSEAITAFDRVHRNIGEWWSVSGSFGLPEEYNTVSKMSAYFKTIYTDDIADDAWMYAFKTTPFGVEYPMRTEGDEILTYSVDSSGVLHIADNYSNNFTRTFIFESNYACKLPFDIIQNIKGDKNNATATIVIEHGYSEITDFGTVNISFKKTDNGWRIAKSDFTDFIIKHDCSKYKIIVSEQWGWATRSVFEHLWKQSKAAEKYEAVMLGSCQVKLYCIDSVKIIDIGLEKMTIAVELKNKAASAYEWYTAEFEISKGENINKDGQVLNLTGGELKNLLEGRTAVQYNPETGDNNNLAIYFICLPIALILSCIVIKKRYY